MGSSENFIHSEQHSFTLKTTSRVSKFISSGIIYPAPDSDGDMVYSGGCAVNEFGIALFVHENIALLNSSTSVPMQGETAQGIVAGVLYGWAESGFLPPGLLRGLEQMFSPDEVVSESSSHVVRPKSVSEHIRMDLTDNPARERNLHNAVTKYGLIMKPEDVRILNRRATAAHELGHALHMTIEMLDAKRRLVPYDHAGVNFHRIEKETLQFSRDNVAFDLLTAYPLSAVSNEIVHGGHFLSLSTSAERVSQGLEYIQVYSDLLKCGVLADDALRITDTMRVSDLKYEREYAALAMFAREKGIDITRLLRTLPISKHKLIQEGYSERVAYNAIGASAVQIGYSNGLTVEQLNDWFVRMTAELQL